MLRALNTHYGSIHNARVIHNGRDPEYFKPEAKRDFILSAGRLWDEAKNINRLAEITPELPWPVFVAGDFQPPEQQPQNNRITRQCRWLGSLSESELRPWFAAASVYALPALYEPFGYTPLEAALSGCALVLGDIESLREIWRDGAVFVNPNDRDALKSQLLLLIQNEQYRRDMSRRARKRALEFTSSRMAQNYFAAYSELLVHSRTTHEQETFAQCA
jgi:glycosyltransferase involved in cell wall biosynthesis